MRVKVIAIAVMSVLPLFTDVVVAAAPANDQPLTVNIKRLSLDTALRMAKAAIDQCRKEGVQIAVTVLDRGGNEQVVLTDVLAMPLATIASKKKAYTAMSFNMPTSQLVNRFPGSYSVPKVDEVMISPGAVPINIGGNIMGGIGVSGAPSGLTDELCAEAGLAAVREDLEME